MKLKHILILLSIFVLAFWPACRVSYTLNVTIDNDEIEADTLVIDNYNHYEERQDTIRY